MGHERYKSPPRPAFFTLSSSRFVHCVQRPTGAFCYCLNALSSDEEDGLACELADLPFKPFGFMGTWPTATVVSFGYHYDYDRCAVVGTSPFPSFLVSLRTRLPRYSTGGGGSPPSADQRVSAGTGIGWHRDKTQFDEVAGVSLLAPCVLRFRQKAAGLGTKCRSRLSRAQLIFFRGPPALCGGTAFPCSMSFVTITLRTLVAKAVLVRRAHNGSALIKPPQLPPSTRKSRRFSDRTVLTRMPVVTDA
jgi:hypothetical protein